MNKEKNSKKREPITIPYVAYESEVNRMERLVNRLIGVIVIMFIGMMIYFLLPTEMSTDETTQSVDNIDNSEVTQTIGE